MLIEWLPTALKLFSRVASKSSARRQVKQPGRTLMYQVENLEARQLLTTGTTIPLAEVNVTPTLPTLPTVPTLPPFVVGTPAVLPAHNDNAISGVLQQIAAGGTSTTFDASGLTSNPIDLVSFDDAGRVGVRVTSANVTALQAQLSSLGFVTAAARPDLNFIEGYIPTYSLKQLGNLGVGVVPIYRPFTSSGPTVDPASSMLGADRVVGTNPPGYDGTGVRIGILSDSFNIGGGPLAATKNGDLPSSVQILQEGPKGLAGPFLQSVSNDEGRAMAELIHDTAPGASLSFASAVYSQASFAQNIRDLADPAKGRADILVDDVQYPDEPMFQDGVIAQAINDVVNNNGVAYFTAAGNYGSQSFEVTNPTFIPDPRGQFGFGPGLYLDFGAAIGSNNPDIQNRIFLTNFFGNPDSLKLALQWDDPFYTTNGVQSDLDIFLVDQFGNVVSSSTDNNIANQTPFETVSTDLSTTGFGFAQVNVIIRLDAGPAPRRIKWIDYGSHSNSFFNSTFQYDTQSSTASGHVKAEGAMAVAAAPYYDSLNPESTSSTGDVVPVGSTTPAPNIFFSPTGVRLNTPESRLAPDIMSLSATNTSFFNDDIFATVPNDVEGDGLPNFFGTSAAASHAAAVAALIKQANPDMAPQQIYERLTSTARDITTIFDQNTGITTDITGVDRVTGYGLIDAYKAVFGPVIQGTLNFADSFESGALSGVWDTNNSGSGTVAVGSADGSTDGANSLTLGAAFAGFIQTSNFFFTQVSGQSEAILHLDLSTAEDDVRLSFDAKTSDTSGQTLTTMSPFFFQTESSDGVAFSVDGGLVWYRITSLAGAQISDTFRNYNLNLTQIAANAGIGLGSDVLIKFQHFATSNNFSQTVVAPITITIDNVQVFTKEAPVVVLESGHLNYPVGSPPAYAFPTATIQAPHTAVFDGGVLTVAITGNASTSDRVEIVDQSKIPNYIPTNTDITLSGNRVLFNGVEFGTYMGGSGIVPLTINLNGNATRAIVQALLRDITFRTSTGAGLNRTLQVTVNDGSGAPSGTASRIVDVVAALNIAPVITLSPTTLNLQPGIAATVIDGTATVTDADSKDLNGGVLTFKISANASTTYDRLEIKNQGNGVGQIGFAGTTIKYQGVTIGTLLGGTTNRTVTLNSNATPAAVQALVRAITFRTISSSAPLATRTIQFQLTDGDGGTSLVATKLINVVKKNQSPVLQGTSTIPKFRLGFSPVVIEPAALVTDPDSLNFNGGSLTVSVTGNGTAFDKLAVRNQGTNIGQIAVSGGTIILYGGIQIGTATGGTGSSSPLVITFNTNANSAAVRALMRNITFETAGATPSLRQRTVSYSLRDGQGGISNTLTKGVAVTT